MTKAFKCDNCLKYKEGQPKQRHSLDRNGVFYVADLCSDCAYDFEQELSSIISNYGMTVDRNLAALHVLARERGKIEA